MLLLSPWVGWLFEESGGIWGVGWNGASLLCGFEIGSACEKVVGDAGGGETSGGCIGKMSGFSVWRGWRVVSICLVSVTLASLLEAFESVINCLLPSISDAEAWCGSPGWWNGPQMVVGTWASKMRDAWSHVGQGNTVRYFSVYQRFCLCGWFSWDGICERTVSCECRHCKWCSWNSTVLWWYCIV